MFKDASKPKMALQQYGSRDPDMNNFLTCGDTGTVGPCITFAGPSDVRILE